MLQLILKFLLRLPQIFCSFVAEKKELFVKLAQDWIVSNVTQSHKELD